MPPIRQFGSKINKERSKIDQNRSKLGPSWAKLDQVGAKLASVSMLEGPRGALGGAQTFKIDFLLILEANMGPSWGQAGATLAPESDP